MRWVVVWIAAGAVVIAAAGFLVYWTHRSERLRIPPSGGMALAALEKLQAKREAGITMGEYSRECGEMWSTVKPFLESADSKKCPSFALRVDHAAHIYMTVNRIWQQPCGDPDDYTPDVIEAELALSHTQVQLGWYAARGALLQARMIFEGQEITQSHIEKMAEIAQTRERLEEAANARQGGK